ncbi:MAG TPA: hypothetical protein DHW34_05635 [Actinobacteria bacterium]|nr:hypothetical protein [Actinomycetota bacterium]HCK79479.1 hypothetical protein [Actinomycetota bacterium]
MTSPVDAIPVVRDLPERVGLSVALFHGFGRGPDALDDLTSRLVAVGAEVLRPHLRSSGGSGGMNDIAVMGTIAQQVEAQRSPGVPLVIIGHSAGGQVALEAARTLVCDGADVRGVILIDGNASRERVLEPAYAQLVAHGVPVRLIAGAPGRCNRGGRLEKWLSENASGFAGVRVLTGRHCDVEGERADLACRLLCGGVKDSRNVEVLMSLVREWVIEWSTGPGPTLGAPAMGAIDEWVTAGVVRPIVGANSR